MNRRDPSAAARTSGQWPIVVVVLGAIAGLVIAMVGDDSWRLGAVVIGASVGFGALERMVLPNRQAGLLQVRGKAFDVAVLALTGAAIIVLALAVPPRR
jgi:uncharacterized membrane protein